MKLAYALASSSLLPFGYAIDPKRIRRNLRHIESAKNENVERLLADDLDSMSMAAMEVEAFGTTMGGSKSQKVRSHRSRIDGRAYSPPRASPISLVAFPTVCPKLQEHDDFYFVGHEECVDSEFNRYDSITYMAIDDEDECKATCRVHAGSEDLTLRGMEYTPAASWCYCLFDDGDIDSFAEEGKKPEDSATVNICTEGTGPVSGTEIGSVVLKGGPLCYRYGSSGLKVSTNTANANSNEVHTLTNCPPLALVLHRFQQRRSHLP